MLDLSGPEIGLHESSVLMGWRMMGGIEWPALDVVAEVVGVQDPEIWLHGLTIVRDRLMDAVKQDEAEPDEGGFD